MAEYGKRDTGGIWAENADLERSWKNFAITISVPGLQIRPSVD